MPHDYIHTTTVNLLVLKNESTVFDQIVICFVAEKVPTGRSFSFL